MLDVIGFLMEIGKELSFHAGQTELACMDKRASGDWVTMDRVKSVLIFFFFCFSRGHSATTLECNSVAI